MEALHPDSQVIDRMGGPVAVARMCKIRSQAVSQWRRAGIPPARRQYLELVAPHAFDAQAQGPNHPEPVRNAA